MRSRRTGRKRVVVRNVLRRLAVSSGLTPLCERHMRDRVTILTYHRVLADADALNYPFSALAIPASAFRAQVRWLATKCHLVTVAEALNADTRNRTFGNKPVVCVTFDDGYQDNYQTVAGVLEQAGIRGTFYITAGLIGTDALLWFDQAALYWDSLSPVERTQVIGTIPDVDHVPGGSTPANRTSLPGWMQILKACSPAARAAFLRRAGPPPLDSAKRFRLMGTNDVVNLHRRGHEIGSHTMTHPLLPQLSDDELRNEIGLSRKILRDLTSSDVPGLCYPNGDYDSRVSAAAREAGYTYACTTVPGQNRPVTESGRMELRRINIDPRRVTRPDGNHDEIGFRTVVCQLFGGRL